MGVQPERLQVFTSTNSQSDSQFLVQAQQRLADFDALRDLGLICSDSEFFQSVHYPPMTMYQPSDASHLFNGYTLPSDGMLDVYAHMPCCRWRYAFRHYSLRLGPGLGAEKDRHPNAIEREMGIYLRHLGVDQIKAHSVLPGRRARRSEQARPDRRDGSGSDVDGSW